MVLLSRPFLSSLVGAAALLSMVVTAVVIRTPTGTLDEKPGGWEACDPSVDQWAGYFTVNKSENKNYFYWMFEARSGANASTPIILWLTGGPGCSSTLAILAENGPCLMNETSGDIYNNAYSWNNEAAVIYIDQPAGVGYSYADQSGSDTDEQEVAHDMYYFVQALLSAHPTFVNRPFFVSGESYGGHFAPATANRIYIGNQNKEGTHVNLTGLTIGNGLVDPYIQYQFYAELAYNWCKTEKGTPCVSESTYESMVASIPSCLSYISSCTNGSAFGCELADLTCNSQLSDYQETGLNVYNIKEECTYQPLCYNFDAVTTFLNRADVQKALNVNGGITWQACNDQVNGDFSLDWFQQFATKIPPLLASGIRVLIYNGDLDFICNWIGGKHWALDLVWPGQTAFQNAADNNWNVAGESAAAVRFVNSTASPILYTFMQVHGAGHMVPMDQPQRASAMINNFLANKAWV